VLESIAPYISSEQRIAWATKGFESGSGKLLHEVAQDVFGEQKSLAVISGPTFAKEVAKGLPTAVTVASNDTEFANFLADRLHTETFRVYTSDDIVGVEVGGAVKNVLAIAAGIADGLNFGANARTALITRGLAEIMRLGDALGGQRETFMGLAGLGDLVLTCTDNQSRNRRLGLGLGQGQSLEDALAAIDQVVEGVQTAREVNELAISRGVDMPITHEVYRILYEGEKPRDAVHALLSREQKAESI
jgi:glycerol-3-phosphate dehydrogenase (NAD(P)+)